MSKEGQIELISIPVVFTHRQLVEIAYKWAVKNASVGVVFKELYSLASEIPDVIGFGGWESVVIECKVSRGDFLKDKKKPHRSKGMGNWRFFCCPAGLIKVDELPEKWGLIYVDQKGKAKIEYDCRKKKVMLSTKEIEEFGLTYNYRNLRADENRFECDQMEERRLMYTALRRLFIRGRIDEIYSMKEIN